MHQKYLVSPVPSTSRWHKSHTAGARRCRRQSCAGVTRQRQKRARHGRCVPFRQRITRHARAGIAAAAVADGLRAHVRGQARPDRRPAAPGPAAPGPRG